MEHFFPEFSWKPKKKGVHQKWNIFSPSSNGNLRSDADHNQIIGGDTFKLSGGIYPSIPPLRVSAPLRMTLVSFSVTMPYSTCSTIERIILK